MKIEKLNNERGVEASRGNHARGVAVERDKKKEKQRKQFNTNNSLLLSVSGAIKNISVSVSGRKMHFL